MESEEAILENENNSNLECESGLRSRDESICVDEIYFDASVVTGDLQPSLDFSDMMTSNSATEIQSLNKVLSCTQAKHADKSDDRLEESIACEKSVGVEYLNNSAKSAVESENSIWEYDFISPSTVSKPDESSSSKGLHSVDHILSSSKEKHVNPLESAVEEDDDDVILSHIENLHERQSTHDIEEMETDATCKLAMQTEGRPSVENANICKLKQTEPSNAFHTSFATSKSWEDDIDLLGEDSQDSVNIENNIKDNCTDISISTSESFQPPSLGLSENRTLNVTKKPDSFEISEAEDMMVEEERHDAGAASEYLHAQPRSQSGQVEKDINVIEVANEEWVAQVKKINDTSATSANPQLQFCGDDDVSVNISDVNQCVDIMKGDIQDSETNKFSEKACSKFCSSDDVQSVEKMNIVVENVVNEAREPTALSSVAILNVSSPDSSKAKCMSSEISKQVNENEVEMSTQASTPMDTANNNDSQGERTVKTPMDSSGDSSIQGSSIKQNSGLPLNDPTSTDPDLELVEIIEETNATPVEVNSHDSAKLRPPDSECSQINKQTEMATSVLVDATKHGNTEQKDSSESNGSVNKTSNHDKSSDQLKISEIKTESDPCNVNGSAGDLLMYENELASQEVKQEPQLDTADDDDDVMVIDDEGEFLPLKKEIGASKTTENGVDAPMPGNVGAEKNLGTSSESSGNSKADSSKSKSAKQKLQTCVVCQKICRCKFNIVRNGDVKHLCDDSCFKNFRKSPSRYLKQKKNPEAPLDSTKDTASPDSPPISAKNVSSSDAGSTQESLYKTCSVCQLIDVNTSQPFCNWKGLDFCGESCLGKFQANLNVSCSFCHSYIPAEARTNFCLKIGNNMRPFCKLRCYNEFQKKLRLCSFCQRDVTSEPVSFTAIVGADNKFREFCSQACMKNMESQVNDVEVLSVEKGHVKKETITCSVCKKQGPIQYTVRLQDEWSKLCSDLCLSAFQYTNKISMGRCDSCGVPCTTEEAQAHFIQHEGKVKRFCSDVCVNVFRTGNSKVMPCGWCGDKKLNFDMIERLDTENKFQLFCSLNCLSLYRVSLQAKSNQAVQCDQCRKVVPAQYHLTMSDASVRNFCCYTCVMNFQVQFEIQRVPPVIGSAPQLPSSSQGQFLPQGTPVQQNQPLRPATAARGGRGGRMATRQATAKEQAPSYPIISSVISLAEQDVNPPVMPVPQPVLPQQVPQFAAVSSGVTQVDNMLPSGDGKHQIIIQAAVPKYAKNKSLQCRPAMQTKATSCRPHTQNKEVQTDAVPIERVLVPVPVPIYIPMPTVMFTAPAPKIVPIPIPIPVPVFIPTTRKSINGICKTIQDIVERIPADPLEAELLMMAEAVAADKSHGDSDTDSEADADVGQKVLDGNESLAEREIESSTVREKEGQGDADMLQLALRMAEEMSGPIEDLEASVEPLTVKKEPPGQQQKNVETYSKDLDPDDDNDDDYIPPQPSRSRGVKRSNRGRPPSTRQKRQRTERTSEDESTGQSGTSSWSQPSEPPPDVNYRLKFTYGLNAWRHWVISKNMQIEKSKSQMSVRARPFPTDILKCTVDELNMAMCFFVDEVRKPSGNEYSPDSIYYLCLGIQQYLYENGRIDSIFTDPYFEKFTDRLNELLKALQPKINKHGQMLCRIEEEHLWESKQLGAHSPFVLLNTLVYFHTKYFILKTVPEHMALSFAQILKHWKKGVPVKGQAVTVPKNVSLRFYCLTNGKKDVTAKKGKEGVPVYEVTENVENPLRCPVKLYEFFLSKCPETIKSRNDIFYPVPERSCVPDSPVWYSAKSIDTHTMEKMMTRILLVREIQEAHLHAQPIYL